MMDGKEHVLVVGGGLVGSLLSIFLARRGYAVTVLERRSDMRVPGHAAEGRSINLAISTRGLHALSLVGLEEKVLQMCVPMHARMVHANDGQTTWQPYGKDDSEHINSISRSELNKVLMDEAETSGRVQFHFNTRVTSCQVETGVVTATNDATGEHFRFEAARVFGTDGANSAIRHALIAHGITKSTEDLESYGYKELTIPSLKEGKFQLEKNALHIWPRVNYMLIALPNLEGTFTCTLFLANQGSPSFQQLPDEPAVLKFFKEYFPDVVPLIPNLTEEFFHNPTGKLVTIRSEPWNFEDKILLLGDAAHAIVPFFGQGMNCGFEDVVVFFDLLDQKGGQWDGVFREFSRLRKPDADAISHMARENFVEMRDKVGQKEFQFRKQVEKVLNLRHPSAFVPRYSLVTFTRVPYAFAEKVGRIQDEILEELCAEVTKVNEVSLEKADALIHIKLAPVMKSQRVF